MQGMIVPADVDRAVARNGRRGNEEVPDGGLVAPPDLALGIDRVDVAPAGHVDGPVRPQGRRRIDRIEVVEYPLNGPAGIHCDETAPGAAVGAEIQRPVGPDGGHPPAGEPGHVHGPENASLRREGVPMACLRGAVIPPDVDRAVGSDRDTGPYRCLHPTFRKRPFERNGPGETRPFPHRDRQPPRHSLTGRRDGRRAVAQARDGTSGRAVPQDAVPAHGRDLGRGGRPRKTAGIKSGAVQHRAVRGQRVCRWAEPGAEEADGSFGWRYPDRRHDRVGCRGSDCVRSRGTGRRGALSAAPAGREPQARARGGQDPHSARQDHPPHRHRVPQVWDC